MSETALRLYGPDAAVAALRYLRVQRRSERLVAVGLDERRRVVGIADVSHDPSGALTAGVLEAFASALPSGHHVVVMATRPGASTLPTARDLETYHRGVALLTARGITVDDWVVVAGNRRRSLVSVQAAAPPQGSGQREAGDGPHAPP